MLPGRGVPFVAGLLYPHVRSDCFQVFYTSRVSWIWLEYDGPPMEKGYLKLDVLGTSNRRIVALSYYLRDKCLLTIHHNLVAGTPRFARAGFAA